LTPELWAGHLAGKRGVGVPPLLDDGTCVWGAIDVDVYDLDLPALVKKVQGLGLPLVVCRTKSGGAHLYLFLSGVVLAVLVRTKLASWAVSLGYPGVEVFPKQDYLMWRVSRRTQDGLVEDSAHRNQADAEARVTALRALTSAPTVIIDRDKGNWLNAPYYGGELSTRYALGPDGKAVAPDEFVSLARAAAVTAEELAGIEAVLPTTYDRLPGAPPCLVTLAGIGFGQGARNNALYQLAVYARKRQPEGWAAQVAGYNSKLLNPPLTDIEVRTVVRSVGRKDYQYRCTQPPFKAVCQKSACKEVEFGIGYGTNTPDERFRFGTFTKVTTKPPIWLLEVNDIMVEFPSLDSVTRQAVFSNTVATAIWPPQLFPTMRGAAWRKFVEELLARCEMEDVPSDATPEGQLSGHLARFCASKAKARTLDELLLGKPFISEGRAYFIAADFLAYLQQQRVQGITERRLYAWLRDHQLVSSTMVLKGEKAEVWNVPAPEAQTEAFDVPRVGSMDDDGEHRYEF
jgi:hypothetical protein